jgi:uncharacterized protein HemX
MNRKNKRKKTRNIMEPTTATITTTLALAIVLAMTFMGVSNILFYLLIRKKEIQQKQLFNKVLEMKDEAIQKQHHTIDQLADIKQEQTKKIDQLNAQLASLASKGKKKKTTEETIYQIDFKESNQPEKKHD